MDRLRFGVLLGLCLVTLTLEARPLTAADVPKPLEPWVGWVLKYTPQLGVATTSVAR
jgi:hypothetical protein